MWELGGKAANFLCSSDICLFVEDLCSVKAQNSGLEGEEAATAADVDAESKGSKMVGKTSGFR